MSDVVYRTTDLTRWGTGQGSNLTPPQVDINFWILASAIMALQDHSLTNQNLIDYFSVNGDQLYITMANHEVFGPYTLPVAQWNFTGPWAPDTVYAVMDLFTIDGSLYLVIYPNTSGGSFDETANDGHGHNFYALVLAQPEDELPNGGEVGQVLTVIDSGSPHGTPLVAWEFITRNLGVYIEGVPEPSELILQYVSPETMVLPAGLVNSQAYHATAPSTEQVYTLERNHVTIGTVTFDALSPGSVTFAFGSPVTFNPGDVFSLIAPPHPDPHMVDISFTFVAQVAQAT
jgi:hypothetical protein